MHSCQSHDAGELEVAVFWTASALHMATCFILLFVQTCWLSCVQLRKRQHG